MKRYKLKSWVKDTLFIILMLVIFIAIAMYGSDRIEKINNGEMIILTDYEG